MRRCSVCAKVQGSSHSQLAESKVVPKDAAQILQHGNGLAHPRCLATYFEVSGHVVFDGLFASRRRSGAARDRFAMQVVLRPMGWSHGSTANACYFRASKYSQHTAMEHWKRDFARPLHGNAQLMKLVHRMGQQCRSDTRSFFWGSMWTWTDAAGKSVADVAGHRAGKFDADHCFQPRLCTLLLVRYFDIVKLSAEPLGDDKRAACDAIVDAIFERMPRFSKLVLQPMEFAFALGSQLIWDMMVSAGAGHPPLRRNPPPQKSPLILRLPADEAVAPREMAGSPSPFAKLWNCRPICGEFRPKELTQIQKRREQIGLRRSLADR